MDSKDTIKGVISGLLAALIWGAFPVFTKFAVDNSNLLDMSAFSS